MFKDIKGKVLGYLAFAVATVWLLVDRFFRQEASNISLHQEKVLTAKTESTKPVRAEMVLNKKHQGWSR